MNTHDWRLRVFGVSCFIPAAHTFLKMVRPRPRHAVGSGVAIVLNASSTALGLIGFHSNGVLSGTTTLVSSQGVNVNPIRNVYVKLQNLNIRNRYNKSTSKVIAKIPIDVDRNGVVFYTAHSNISSYILDPLIDTIELILCDELERELDFNSMSYSLCLGLVFDRYLVRDDKQKLIGDELISLAAWLVFGAPAPPIRTLTGVPVWLIIY